MIPLIITYICSHAEFNEILRGLPSTITHITFGDSFNHSVNRVLPSSLLHLTFGKSYNSSVRYLPNNITHLTFGDSFNLPVDFLPKSITHLTFGEEFNQPLTNLPPTLQLLKLDTSYHYEDDDLRTYTNDFTTKLPSSLFELKYCTNKKSKPLDLSKLLLTVLDIRGLSDAVQNISNLPTTLVHLRLDGRWDGLLDSLPESLKQLDIDDDYFNTPLEHLPPSLTGLMMQGCNRFSHPFHCLPPLIIKLRIPDGYNIPLHLNSYGLLTHLTLGDDFNQPLGNLPSSLTHLSFGESFNQPVDELPDNITHLTFGLDFNRNVGALPGAVIHLVFGYDFNQPVDSIPLTTTHLTFGYSFNQTVQHLPQKLTHLSFGYSFNQDISTLPSSITHLKLGVKYATRIYKLPPSLSSFYFTCDANPLADFFKLLTLLHSANDVKITTVGGVDQTYFDYRQLVKGIAFNAETQTDSIWQGIVVRFNLVSRRLSIDRLSLRSFIMYDVANFNKFEG